MGSEEIMDHLSPENKEGHLRETALQDYKNRFADKQGVQEQRARSYALFAKIVTSLIASSVTGTSLSMLVGGYRNWAGVTALVFFWMALGLLMWEILATIRYAEKQEAKLADESKDVPAGTPEGNGFIFGLQIAIAAIFMQGVLFLGISWFVA